MGKLTDLIAEKAKRDAQKRSLPKGVSESEDWVDGLLYDEKWRLLGRVSNYALVLGHHEKFKGRLSFNSFADALLFDGKQINDSIVAQIRADMEHVFPQKVSASDLFDAVVIAAKRNSFHPVREYLDAIKWDGTKRLGRFFSDYCGTPYDAYHHGVGVAHFVSAVKRIYEPGCKVDLMVVLESPQGWGKTTLWSVLYAPWHTEITSGLDSKDFFVGLRGAWCCDFGEMHQVKKSDAERVKQILTIQADSYRPPYGRCAVSYPRECIFVGGTNQDQWLIDTTGGRRFLPVRLGGPIDVDMVRSVRDQLFAEAKSLLKSGCAWWDVPDAVTHQSERLEYDEWQDIISDWLDLNEATTKVLKGSDILDKALGIPVSHQGRAEYRRVSAIMQALGYRRQAVRGGKVEKGYKKQ